MSSKLNYRQKELKNPLPSSSPISKEEKTEIKESNLSRKETQEKQRVELLLQLEDRISESKRLNQPCNKASTFLVDEDSGKIRQIPLLSKYWVEKLQSLDMLAFLPIDNNIEQSSSSTFAGISIAETYELLQHDLAALLKFEHHIFWSFILHDRSIVDFLDKFLRYYRPLSSEKRQNSTAKTSTEINRRLLFERVFKILLRMSVNFEGQKNSNQRWFEPHFFSEMLSRDVRVFTVPRIMDIIRIYKDYNYEVTFDLIRRVFSSVHYLPAELNKALQQISNVLLDMIQTISSVIFDDQFRIDSSIASLNELLDYLADISSTTSRLISIVGPEIGRPLFQHHFRCMSQPERLISQSLLVVISFYLEAILPRLFSLFFENRLKRQFGLIGQIEEGFALIIHAVYSHTFKEKIMKRSAQENSSDVAQRVGAIESFFCGFKSCANDLLIYHLDSLEFTSSHQIHAVLSQNSGGTLAILNRLFDICDDLDFYSNLVIGERESIINTLKTIKNMKVPVSDFVLDEIKEEFDESGEDDDEDEKPDDDGEIDDPEWLSGRKGLVDRVQAVLADSSLGEGFIDECLKFYKDNVEEFINSYLEDNLPSQLLSIPRELDRPRKIRPPVTITPSNLKSQKNKKRRKDENVKQEELEDLRRSFKNTLFLSGSRGFDEDTYDDEYDDSFDHLVPFNITGESDDNDELREEEEDTENGDRERQSNRGGGGGEYHPHNSFSHRYGPRGGDRRHQGSSYQNNEGQRSQQNSKNSRSRGKRSGNYSEAFASHYVPKGGTK